MRGFAFFLVALTLLSGASTASAEGLMPVEGDWRGETSAGLPLHFTVKDGRVTDTQFGFRWGFCGVFESRDKGADLAIDPSGHWIFHDPRGQTLEGTFVAPDRAEGTVVSVERELPGCPRTEATFTAAPNPESMAAARAGIEALPYDIDLREPPGVANVLVGRVHGSLGETVRFFLFVNRNAAKHLPGVPGYGFHGPHDRILNRGLEGGSLGNTDVIFFTVYRRGESKAQINERFDIGFAIEDDVCRRQTGKVCPAL
jgi:hypothetical protein